MFRYNIIASIALYAIFVQSSVTNRKNSCSISISTQINAHRVSSNPACHSIYCTRLRCYDCCHFSSYPRRDCKLRAKHPSANVELSLVATQLPHRANRRISGRHPFLSLSDAYLSLSPPSKFRLMVATPWPCLFFPTALYSPASPFATLSILNLAR